MEIKLGISHCLLGENVRYDGQHKLDRYLRDTLGAYVTWVPVCPEVECGLSIPREAMHLVGTPESPRLVTIRSSIDHTARMLTWAKMRLKQLEKENLCGFVFKAKSPSSGMTNIKIYHEKSGHPYAKGQGLFAREFMRRFPLLPVEDDGRLHDDTLRENFIERVFAFARFREFERTGGRRGGLVNFHTDHKLLIMAHSPAHARELGQLVARAKAFQPKELRARYLETLLAAIKKTATVSRHTNVLHHAVGYFKKVLTADEKQELLEIIDRYRNGLIPLIVPVTLIAHFVRKYDEPFLKRQYYLHPHPAELKLRNHV